MRDTAALTVTQMRIILDGSVSTVKRLRISLGTLVPIEATATGTARANRAVRDASAFFADPAATAGPPAFADPAATADPPAFADPAAHAAILAPTSSYAAVIAGTAVVADALTKCVLFCESRVTDRVLKEFNAREALQS